MFRGTVLPVCTPLLNQLSHLDLCNCRICKKVEELESAQRLTQIHPPGIQWISQIPAR